MDLVNAKKELFIEEFLVYWQRNGTFWIDVHY